MSHSLLVCKRVVLDRFQKEHFFCEDNILALVESGSFLLREGDKTDTVGPCEAACFRGGVSYFRRLAEPSSLFLFRYRSTERVFPSGKIVFREKERIQSTLRLLNLSEGEGFFHDFECKRSLFGDLVTQYRLENPLQIHALAKSDPMIFEAILYINANLHKKLNLAELASAHYLSYVQFSRRFKNAVGTTFQNYLADIRLKKAKSLLQNETESIRDIAAACGFQNEYYFSNFFRKHLGISTSEFRAVEKL